MKKVKNFLIGITLKIYLQVLFLFGAYFTRIQWIDKQIKWCYNTFDNLKIPYQKYYYCFILMYSLRVILLL